MYEYVQYVSAARCHEVLPWAAQQRPVPPATPAVQGQEVWLCCRRCDPPPRSRPGCWHVSHRSAAAAAQRVHLRHREAGAVPGRPGVLRRAPLHRGESALMAEKATMALIRTLSQTGEEEQGRAGLVRALLLARHAERSRAQRRGGQAEPHRQPGLPARQALPKQTSPHGPAQRRRCRRLVAVAARQSKPFRQLRPCDGAYFSAGHPKQGLALLHS